jgi:hypothetical protein
MMDASTRRDNDTKEKKKKAKAESTKTESAKAESAKAKGGCDAMKKPVSAVMKRPGSATISKASSAVKRPASFAGSPKPKMPTSHSSVEYKGGKIYTQWAKKKSAPSRIQ